MFPIINNYLKTIVIYNFSRVENIFYDSALFIALSTLLIIILIIWASATNYQK